MKFHKFLYLLFFSISASCLAFQPGENLILTKHDAKDQLLTRSAEGKDFWLAVPPNELYRNTGQKGLEIYVASRKKTTVTMEIPSKGVKITKKVDSLAITSFNNYTDNLTFDLEIYESEQNSPKTIHIYSTDSISVYMINSKTYSSEGLLALPVSSWGKEYIHLGYYDNHIVESNYTFSRGSGFVIISAYPNTRCKIFLKGIGKGLAKTLGGRNIGDTIEVTLQQGENYLVMGDGSTLESFDLSGSKVVSDKPVGFISFHMRTSIPSNKTAMGRNYLVEMMPPLSAWGKEYATVEFARQGKGDFFRIIAGYDSTSWTVTSYNPNNNAVIEQHGGLLTKSGDFEEFVEDSAAKTSLRGSTVWKANKPVLVMQYSYSASWDNSLNFDPFMILVSSVEQYTKSTIFQTPSGILKFNYNYLNIIAIGDSTLSGQTLLKSIKIDTNFVYKLNNKFLTNRIPGTDLYWVKLQVEAGVHKVEGDTYLGGYVYGFAEFDSYGWPAAMSINIINETDTIPPGMIYTDICGMYHCTASEHSNGSPDDIPRQVDLGIKSIKLLDASYNFDLRLVTSDSIPQFPPVHDFDFTCEVKDKRKPALALIEIIDHAGNSVVKEIRYDPSEKARLTFFLDKFDSKTQYFPGDTVHFHFRISSPDWSQAPLTDFRCTFSTRNAWMKFLPSSTVFFKPDSTWTFDLSENNMGTTNEITIHGHGVTPLNADIILAGLAYLLYLSDTASYSLATGGLHTDLPSDCILLDSIDGKVELKSCAINLRLIKTSPYDFSLAVPVPNPVSSESVNIDFSVGLKCFTTIKFYDYTGRCLESVFSGSPDPGYYQVTFPVSRFTSGVYYIVMTSGDFSKTGQLILIR